MNRNLHQVRIYFFMEVYFATEKLLKDKKFLFTLGCDYQAEHPNVEDFDCYRTEIDHMPAVILFDKSKNFLTYTSIKPMFSSFDCKTHLVREIIMGKRNNGELKIKIKHIPLDDLDHYVTMTSDNFKFKI